MKYSLRPLQFRDNDNPRGLYALGAISQDAIRLLKEAPQLVLLHDIRSYQPPQLYWKWMLNYRRID